MKLWSNREENEQLLKYIEEATKAGNTINYGCERFCAIFPDYTIDQARSRYYQLINSNGQMNEQTIVKAWSDEQDKLLLEYYEAETKKGKTKTKIFQELAKQLNRSFNSISGRYYNLTCKKTKVKEKHKVKEINVNEFMKLLSGLDIEGLNQIFSDIKTLKKTLSPEDAALTIQNLRNELENSNSLKANLQEIVEKQNKELAKINSQYDLLKTKFDNLKKQFESENN